MWGLFVRVTACRKRFTSCRNWLLSWQIRARGELMKPPTCMSLGFWWALQHSFLPLILDWKYVAWRFLAFLPGVVVFMLSYLKLRRLLPLIVAHWPMDILAILITLKF